MSARGHQALPCGGGSGRGGAGLGWSGLGWSGLAPSDLGGSGPKIRVAKSGRSGTGRLGKDRPPGDVKLSSEAGSPDITQPSSWTKRW